MLVCFPLALVSNLVLVSVDDVLVVVCVSHGFFVVTAASVAPVLAWQYVNLHMVFVLHQCGSPATLNSTYEAYHSMPWPIRTTTAAHCFSVRTSCTMVPRASCQKSLLHRGQTDTQCSATSSSASSSVD
jgi:hypothetical protein